MWNFMLLILTLLSHSRRWWWCFSFSVRSSFLACLSCAFFVSLPGAALVLLVLSLMWVEINFFLSASFVIFVFCAIPHRWYGSSWWCAKRSDDDDDGNCCFVCFLVWFQSMKSVREKMVKLSALRKHSAVLYFNFILNQNGEEEKQKQKNRRRNWIFQKSISDQLFRLKFENCVDWVLPRGTRNILITTATEWKICKFHIFQLFKLKEKKWIQKLREISKVGNLKLCFIVVYAVGRLFVAANEKRRSEIK